MTLPKEGMLELMRFSAQNVKESLRDVAEKSIDLTIEIDDLSPRVESEKNAAVSEEFRTDILVTLCEAKEKFKAHAFYVNKALRRAEEFLSDLPARIQAYEDGYLPDLDKLLIYLQDMGKFIKSNLKVIYNGSQMVKAYRHYVDMVKQLYPKQTFKQGKGKEKKNEYS